MTKSITVENPEAKTDGPLVYLLYNNNTSIPKYDKVFRTVKKANKWIEKFVKEHHSDGVGDGEFGEGGCYEGKTFEEFREDFLEDMSYRIMVVCNVDPDERIYINQNRSNDLTDLSKTLTNDIDEWKRWKKTTEEPKEHDDYIDL